MQALPNEMRFIFNKNYFIFNIEAGKGLVCEDRSSVGGSGLLPRNYVKPVGSNGDSGR